MPKHAPMPEADLQQAVEDLCKVLGRRFYHTRLSRQSVAGFPDLVIVTEARVLFRELKGHQRQGKRWVLGKLTSAQAGWIAALLDAGEDAKVWTPKHWYDGTIDRELWW